ncbi:S1C family serine protease [Pontibacillus salicampi]|uniref:S1C family serine protease n=1 Tax=Pontibacillus salicampi TaxID=1449801 RepID=A0ABV6LPD0_9BACI
MSDNYIDQEQQELQSQPNKNGNKSYYSWLIKFTFSALVVTTILFLGAFGLFKANVFPFNSANGTESSASQPNNDINITQTSTENSAEDSNVVQAVEQVSDAVVGVVKYQQTGPLSESGQSGTGSGVIYKKQDGSAYVVTNHHVIEGAQTIDVVLSGGKKVEGEVLGSDQLTDLAVLKIDGSNVSNVATFGSSEDLKVGETALAIGNPLGLEFAGSVTKGIISGLERTMPVDLNGDGQSDWETDVLQTDAAINPGNSGGALVNLSGEVIGINSMKIAQQEVEGLGFAIPSATAQPVIEDLEQSGEVTRPYMGIQTQDLSTISTRDLQESLKLPSDVQKGVIVAATQSNSPAEAAGLQKYDVIVKADGNDIGSLVELRKYLYEEKSVGDTLELTFYRDGQQQSTTLTLEK